VNRISNTWLTLSSAETIAKYHYDVIHQQLPMQGGEIVKKGGKMPGI
jgi:hypothetical protein